MAFEEAVKITIFAMISSGIIFAYMGFQLRDKDVPIKLLFLSLAVLMTFSSVGVGLRAIEQQADIPTAVQTNVINMVSTIYIVLIWTFVIVLGYFVIMIIRWFLAVLADRRRMKLIDSEDPRI